MRTFLLGLTLLAVTAFLPGCGPEVSTQDLGEIQTKSADLPGSGKEYELPEPQYKPSEEPSEEEDSEV